MATRIGSCSPAMAATWVFVLMTALACIATRAGSIFDDDWVAPPQRGEPDRAKPATPQNPAPPPTPVPTPTPPNIPPPDVTAVDPLSHVPVTTQAPAGRLAIPAPADVAKSRKLMKEVYAAELADHSLTGRQAFSKKLLDEAAKDNVNPADKFVLLGGAITAAEEGGDLPACFTAADRMAAAFDVNAKAVKADAALKMTQKEYVASVVPNVLGASEVLSELASAEDFVAAARLGSVLQSAAAGDSQLSRAIQQRRRDIDAMRSAHDRVAAYFLKLKRSPEDPEANLAVGSYYCFIANQWTRGLPMLAKGSDPVLKDLATSDLANPSAADDVSKLGDGWWEIAGKQTGISHNHICRHAAAYYVVAREGVSGLTRAMLDKRIAEADGQDGRANARAIYLSTVAPARFSSYHNSPSPVNPRVKVNGEVAPHGLSTHPDDDGEARVIYNIEGKYSEMNGAVAVNDDASGIGKSGSPLVFRIIGDGKELWASGKIQRNKDEQPFSVKIGGLRSLELVVRCLGNNHDAHAVWIEPKLILAY